MTSSLQRLAAQLLAVGLVASAGPLAASDTAFDLGGRVSPQITVTAYPEDSVLGDHFGSSSVDSALEARVVLGAERDQWSLDLDYQLLGLRADSLELSRQASGELRSLFPHLPDDSTRLFDLTHVLHDQGKEAALHRLDRLAVGYASDHLVLRLGRQAITWGNGLVYGVMDIFNPFDPAAVDKEYKTGDDMLYGQYLHSSGDDVQGVLVPRRDPLSGEVESDRSSLALKYHHMASVSEFDGLVSRHYGDYLVGAGMNWSIGGSVWRGDLTVAFTDDDTVPSVVTSVSHSWTWGGTNVSGGAEYFYNGFGQSDSCYAVHCLAQNPDLMERVARGELFNLGRSYLALNALIEVTPLFLLTPNVFVNLDDPSALIQVLFQNDLREDLLLWSAITIPLGANGTEFGGAASAVPGLYFSSGPSASLQLVWYW